MDPLSITANVIAVATLAWQSCKSVHGLIDGLADAPRFIADSKSVLSETRNTLDSLKGMLEMHAQTPSVLGHALQKISLDFALQSTQRLCDEFSHTIAMYTSRSTDSTLARRDRLAVNLHESKFNKLNKQLGDCQQTISLALASIILFVLCLVTFEIHQADR